MNESLLFIDMNIYFLFEVMAFVGFYLLPFFYPFRKLRVGDMFEKNYHFLNRVFEILFIYPFVSGFFVYTIVEFKWFSGTFVKYSVAVNDMGYFYILALALLGGVIVRWILLVSGDYSKFSFMDEGLECKSKGLLSRRCGVVLLRNLKYPGISLCVLWMAVLSSVCWVEFWLENFFLKASLVGAFFVPFILDAWLSWIFALKGGLKDEIESGLFSSSYLRRTPIEGKDDDKYDASKYVERLFIILVKDSESRGINLVGGFGAGKSSILKLLSEKLERERSEWIVCEFEGWGRSKDAGVIQEMILESCLETIRKEVSVSSVHGIPRDYRLAINSSDGWFGVLSRLLSVSKNPGKMILKIDDVLKCCGLKLVVYIEDIDRNYNSQQLVEGISSILERLSVCHNIKFIFSVGREATSSDVLRRVCHHRIDVLDVDSRLELRCLFYECCENSYYINKDDSDTLIWPLEEASSVRVHNRDLDEINPLQAICYYLKNPRQINFVLSAVEEEWRRLDGGVNFDDLLILKTLEYCEPGAFSFVANNLLLLRSCDPDKEGEYLKKEWDLSSGNMSLPSLSLCLVCYLFGSFFKVVYDKRYRRRDRAMRVSNDVGVVDYFKRISDIGYGIEPNEIRVYCDFKKLRVYLRNKNDDVVVIGGFDFNVIFEDDYYFYVFRSILKNQLDRGEYLEFVRFFVIGMFAFLEGRGEHDAKLKVAELFLKYDEFCTIEDVRALLELRPLDLSYYKYISEIKEPSEQPLYIKEGIGEFLKKSLNSGDDVLLLLKDDFESILFIASATYSRDCSVRSHVLRLSLKVYSENRDSVMLLWAILFVDDAYETRFRNINLDVDPDVSEEVYKLVSNYNIESSEIEHPYRDKVSGFINLIRENEGLKIKQLVF